MQTHYLQFRISQMRQDKVILILETISIFILALFVSIFLPQLLFQFVFAGMELTAEPPMLKFIPVVSFAVAILYFLYATVMVMMKKMKIMQLEKELSLMMSSDSDMDMGFDNSSDTDKMSMALASSKKSSAKKKVSRK